MIRLSFVASLLPVLLSLPVAPLAAAVPDAPPAPEEFAILPWGWTPAQKPVLDEIRSCGFNLAGFVRPEGLDAVAAAGLKCIVSDDGLHVRDDAGQIDDAEMNKRIKTLVDRIGRHPAVFGYYLRDEPSAKLFGVLAKWSDALRGAAPHARPYINLFPNYANDAQMGVPSYGEYVESFIRVCKPPFVSYDHYALMDDGSLRGGYFQNLEIIRRLTLKHNLPFWNIVLSNGHFRYAEPTEAGLRFQAYTTLAYGARGISYFTYFTPDGGNYRLGPIDQFGDKTATWSMLRRVNLQLHRLMPTYLTLKSVSVFHHPDVPAECAPARMAKHVDQVSGGSFVVGEFEAPNGMPYAMIVNKSLRESAALGVKFKTPGRIVQVNTYTGRTHDYSGENVWLAPGQGVLVGLKK